jgi:membrane carboxypeptidase/penicillin-binding protein
LGAYEVTPLEIGGAYTIYANKGTYSKPYFVSRIGNSHGSEIFATQVEHKQVLDPRIAFLMDSLLEEVVRTGTGAGIWSRGVNFPVAGKTGTSHDGWFAGFSSRLICIVWVGFDDNRPLDLEGARSALPVWAEFMKRAHEHRQYRNVSEFSPPAGVTSVQIDPESGLLATSSCPRVMTEYFVEDRSQWNPATCMAGARCTLPDGIHPQLPRAIGPQPSAGPPRNPVQREKIRPLRPQILPTLPRMGSPRRRVFSARFGISSISRPPRYRSGFKPGFSPSGSG